MPNSQAQKRQQEALVREEEWKKMVGKLQADLDAAEADKEARAKVCIGLLDLYFLLLDAQRSQ